VPYYQRAEKRSSMSRIQTSLSTATVLNTSNV
jgi:hypothetical protein